MVDFWGGGGEGVETRQTQVVFPSLTVGKWIINPAAEKKIKLGKLVSVWGGGAGDFFGY